jgi:hypothetical protein
LTSRSKTKTIEADCWKAFLYRYDPSKAERDLTWPLGYWLQQRDPVPVKHFPRKCVACPLNAVGLCEHALQPPDPGFVVERRPDGRVYVYR